MTGRTATMRWPGILTAGCKLAAAYRDAGDLRRAITMLKQIVADSVRVLGQDHPTTLASRSDLADAYRAAGNLGRAIPLCEQVLAASVRVLGEDHPHTLASHNIAAAYQDAGDLRRAITMFEETLDGCVRVLRAGPGQGPPPDQARAWRPRCGTPATSVPLRTASVPAAEGDRRDGRDLPYVAAIWADFPRRTLHVVNRTIKQHCDRGGPRTCGRGSARGFTMPRWSLGSPLGLGRLYEQVP
jgi:Tetratricopeptide repeat